MLRHDTPHPDRAADRLGANGASAYVFRVSNGNAMGRIAYARVFGGGMNEGAEFAGADGEMTRAGALFTVQGATTAKTARVREGAIVGIRKAEGGQGGDLQLGTASRRGRDGQYVSIGGGG